MSIKQKHPKTNVIRILENKRIPHQVLVYDPSDGRIDALSVAGKLGEAPENLFKTLVGRSEEGVEVFCIPGPAELDLKKAARAAGAKKVELVSVKELQPLTGYVRGGCSPIGMKKAYPLYIDTACTQHEYIVISGGALGVQVRISPQDLLALTGAVQANLCV